MWRPRSASGDIRQRLEHDIRQQEKDDKITVNTYQNKLNSQSYRRLSKPTMTGRPTLSRPSKSVRLLGARSTVECQLSPGQSETQQAVGKRWASVESGQRLWSGKMRNATNNSGHPGLVLLLRCLGVGKARVDSKGSEDCELPWQGACACGCCVMSVRCGCGLRGPRSSKFARASLAAFVVDFGALGPSKSEDTRRQLEGGFTNEHAAAGG
jgi:hypothetical protein